MEMNDFLMSLEEKISRAKEGTDNIDQRYVDELTRYYNQEDKRKVFDFGAFQFVPDINISGGRTTSMGGEEGNTRFVEDEGGGRIGGNVILPSGTSFGGGVSGNYYRGKESSPYHSAKYGPGGSVEEYDAYVSTPSGITATGRYNPINDDYMIQLLYGKRF